MKIVLGILLCAGILYIAVRFKRCVVRMSERLADQQAKP